MPKFLLKLIVLLAVGACVPKPEEISGCKSGTSFSDVTLACVTSSPAITYGSTFNSLSVLEDNPQAFVLPSASSPDVPGVFYYFISTGPTNGIITGCADRDGSGDGTGVGTTGANCTYTPDANYYGSDTFSYRVCNSASGLRCGNPISVAVTVNDDNDAPVLTVNPTLMIPEGGTIAIDVKASRRGADETDSIYVCLTPDASLAADVTGETGVDLTVTPTTTFATGACTLVTTESTLSTVPFAIARFSASASLLACPADNCSGGGNLTVALCEDVGCTGLISTSTVAVTITARNFDPTFALSSPQTLSPATIVEGSAAYTIGTAAANVQDLPVATDADLEAFTYHYVTGSLSPSTAGTLSCTDGTDLACTFTPNADHVGSISFRYYAKDGKTPAGTSSQMTVNWSATAVDDAPVFKTTSQVYALSLAPSALTENTVLTRTLLVGEGGGSDENGQVLSMTATTSDAAVLPLTNIRVYRNGVDLGDLTSSRVLAAAGADADAFSYTMTFTPPTNHVTDDDAIITLTLSDGTNTTPLAFTFNAITNVNNPPTFPTPPGSSFGLQLGVNKDLTFRAIPGEGDWVTIPGASQDLTVTVTSSATTVIDASLLTLATPVGVASVTTGTCTAASCSFTLDYTGTNDPTDDDIDLTIVPGVRGNSTLTITISDGVTSTSRTVAVSVYNFVATFNGWSTLKAEGVTAYNGTQVARASDPANLTVGWNALMVTEGGTPTTAYTVRVFRKATSTYATLSGSSLDDTGVASSVTQASFSDANAPFDDSSSFAAGERFYLTLGVVPTALGDLITPTSATDSAIEVVIPPDNMVLMHRWMANKEFCDATGQTASRTANYRCSNNGLGAILSGGNFYYDQQVHVFVDKFEAGCPFNLTEDGTPTADPVANNGQVHYNRADQLCTIASGGAWVSYESVGAAATVKFNEGQLPPYVNITATNAQAMCLGQNIYCDGVVCGGDFATLDRELPLRREMVAASAWPTTSPSADSLATLEDSGNHAKFACNSNSASGLTFSALGGVTSLVQDTFPASLSAAARGLTNSAAATGLCLSRYGVANSIGNVQELIADRYNCVAGTAPAVACTIQAPLGTEATGARDDSLAANNFLNIVYALNGTAGLGPVLSSTAVAPTLISYLTSNTDRVHRAMGLPFLEDTGLAHPQPGLPRYIASGSGANIINDTLLSGDGLKLDYSANGVYSTAHGESWSATSRVGRYAKRLIPSASFDSQTGFRCVVRLTPQP